ncbi:AAA family ATPase [Enterococcus sp. DIV0876]|uniref:AAA family ATPase n=1 Tax=Enterococcus sp. DIV0876 TaxID=2774633 RepID=UPI003D300FF5
MAATLILLRGNSGSGKTTIAKALHAYFGADALLISQDVFRKEIFHIKDTPNNPAIELMLRTIQYGQSCVPIVIVEGIFSSDVYHDFLKDVFRLFAHKHLVYYFDIPFEITCQRHQTRPQNKQFSETDMRRWWRPNDWLQDKMAIVIDEKVITQEQSETDTTNQIIKDYKHISEGS